MLGDYRYKHDYKHVSVSTHFPPVCSDPPYSDFDILRLRFHSGAMPGFRLMLCNMCSQYIKEHKETVGQSNLFPLDLMPAEKPSMLYCEYNNLISPK